MTIIIGDDPIQLRPITNEEIEAMQEFYNKMILTLPKDFFVSSQTEFYSYDVCQILLDLDLDLDLDKKQKSNG